MRKWYPWLLVGLALGFTAAVYGRLPEQMPTRWGADGQVNGWMRRGVGAWFLPGMMVVLAILLPNIPKIDPRRAIYEKFQPTYDVVIAGVLTMLASLHVAVLGVAIGWPIAMEKVAPVLVGGLFVLIGNVL